MRRASRPEANLKRFRAVATRYDNRDFMYQATVDVASVRIRLRGREVAARPELVREPGEVERLLDVIVAGNPPAAKFIPLPRTADGRLEPDALAAAIDHGFSIVRWHLG